MKELDVKPGDLLQWTFGKVEYHIYLYRKAPGYYCILNLETGEKEYTGLGDYYWKQVRL